jgi:hypothetical protein
MMSCPILTASLLALAVRTAPPPLPCKEPTVDAASAREWSQNVATVIANGVSGYGLVVGWSIDRAWLAVPAHVMFGGDASTDQAGPLNRLTVLREPISIHFGLGGDSRPLCAGLAANPLPRQDLDVDLSFLCVAWSLNPTFNTSVLPW